MQLLSKQGRKHALFTSRTTMTGQFQCFNIHVKTQITHRLETGENLEILKKNASARKTFETPHGKTR